LHTAQRPTADGSPHGGWVSARSRVGAHPVRSATQFCDGPSVPTRRSWVCPTTRSPSERFPECPAAGGRWVCRRVTTGPRALAAVEIAPTAPPGRGSPPSLPCRPGSRRGAAAPYARHARTTPILVGGRCYTSRTHVRAGQVGPAPRGRRDR
jgi:hypothetical protein